jgi:soluble lytic murein transglycosylase
VSAARARGPVLALVLLTAFLGGFGLGHWLPTSKQEVRAMVGAGRPPDLSRFDALIERAAREAGVEADLLRGLVAAESSGDPRARSGAGAVGLTQLMPATAREIAGTLRLDADGLDLTDPRTSLRLGAHHLARLLASLGGEPAFALAAYNAGKTPVLRWRLRAPDADAREAVRREAFAETRHHVARALAFRDAYRAR